MNPDIVYPDDVDTRRYFSIANEYTARHLLAAADRIEASGDSVKPEDVLRTVANQMLALSASFNGRALQ